MSAPDKSIDPRLLTAAKDEFLSHGFEMASLADICRKAGVTTGAVYRRYKGKEDLFAAVVEDTVREMENRIAALSSENNLASLSDRELYDGFFMMPDINVKWLKTLFDRKDEFTLLIKCASGTRYSNFRHEWAQKMNEVVYRYYLEARRRGMTAKVLTQDEMYILSCAVWSLFYEPFTLNFTWEQLQEHAGFIFSLIDWHKALEIVWPE